jgi:hypothetical protein
MAAPSRLLNPFDARSTRGILSRGHARYGVSNSPKPGNVTNIQKAAQNRVKKMQRLNDARRQR